MESEYNILLVSSHPESMEEEVRFLKERDFSFTSSVPGPDARGILMNSTEKYDSILLGPVGEDYELYISTAADLLRENSTPLLFYSEKTDEAILDRFDSVSHKGVIPCSGGPALLKSHLLRSIKEKDWCTAPLERLIRVTEEADGENSKSDYGYIVNGLTDAVLIDSLETGMLSIANKQACELLGLTREEIIEGGIYSSGWDFIHEDLTPYPPEEHPHVIARNTGETVRNVVMGINRPERETLWISTTAIPVFNSNDKIPDAIITTFFDISELVNIRKNNLRFASIFQSADWGILIEDMVEKGLNYNRNYALMHGYTDEELQDKPLIELIVPEEREAVAEALEKALSEDFSRFESHHLRKDGSVFPTISDAKVVKDHRGNPLYRTVNTLDFSETKKQEQTLKDSLMEKDRLLEALNKEKDYSDILFYKSPIAIFSQDRDSKIVHFNQKAEEITGYKREELEGKVFDLWRRRPEHDSENENEYFIISKEGKEKIVERYTAELTDEKGEISGRIESFIDITSWKELQSFRSDMERVIRHDLKTPLNSIIGFPKLMLTDETLSEEYREYLMIILLSGQNMLNLINASLSLYKIEEGTYQFNMEKTDILSQLIQIKSILKDDCRKKKNEIILLLNGEPFPDNRRIRIFTEKSLFTMILINLIKNAVEASPRGEAITVELIGGEEHQEITVHNKGTIPEQIRDRFFDKNVTMGKKNGNGLGTYSAKLMAEAINAKLSFTTGEQEGTTLFLKL